MSRLFDLLIGTGIALVLIYGLPLGIALPFIILPILGLLVFWIIHEWSAARRRREIDG